MSSGTPRASKADGSQRTRLEAAAVARDEMALLEAARDDLWRSLGAKATARSQLVDTAVVRPMSEPQRVVVQNWTGRAGLVPLGDVRIQLEPGQEVTLLVDGVRDCQLEPGQDLEDGLTILADDEALIG